MSKLASIQKSISDEAKLSLLSPKDVSIGDSIYLENRRSNFKVIKTSLSKFITLENNGDIESTLNETLEPGVINYGTDILIGEEIEIVFKVDSLTDIGPGETNIMNINGFNTRMNYRGTVALSVAKFGNINISVEKENGDFLDVSGSLPFNTWIRYKGVLTADKIFNSAAVTLGYFNQVGSKYHIKSFRIKDEIFNLEEGSGNIITGSKGSTFIYRDKDTTAPIGNLRWSIDNPANGMDIIEANGIVLKQEAPKDGFFTLESLGYNSQQSPSDQIAQNNDAAPFAQFILDSGYNLKHIGGNYYYKTPVFIKRTTQIEGNSNAIYQIPGNPTAFNLLDNKGVAYIFTDQDIDIFVIQSHSVTIENLLTSHQEASAYNSTHILIDCNYDLYNIKIRKCTGFGNKNYLLSGTDRGGTHIGTNLDVVSAGNTGFLWRLYVKECFGYWFNYGFDSPNEGPNWVEGVNFTNSWEIEYDGDGCKTYIRCANVDKSYFIARHTQDRAVLVTGEEDRYQFYIDCQNAIIDVWAYDSGFNGTLGASPNTHVNKYLYCPYNSSRIVGVAAALLIIDNKHPDINGIQVEGKHLANLKSFNLFQTSNSMMPLPNNSLEYAGLIGNVTYKGYTAPNTAWFDANLLPADDAANANTLVEDLTNVIITSNGLLRGFYVGRQDFHIVKTSLSFAEIVIDTPTIEKITKVTTRIEHRKPDSIQLILISNDDTINENYHTNTKNELGDFQLFHKNSRSLKDIKRIIIRYIGSNDFNDHIAIQGIGAITSTQLFRPVLDIKGDQKVYGYLDATDLKINGRSIAIHKNTNNTVVNLENVDVYNYNSPSTSKAFVYTNEKILGQCINFVDTTGEVDFSNYTLKDAATGLINAIHLTGKSDAFSVGIFEMHIISYNGIDVKFWFTKHA